MSQFTVKWDDFARGYYVGENESLQPRNAFTGQNVNITTHDGSVAPINKIVQVSGITDDFDGTEDTYTEMTFDEDSLHILNTATGGRLFVSQPVQAGDSVFFAVQSFSTTNMYIWMFQLQFSDTTNPETSAVLYRSDKITISGLDNDIISNVVATQEAAGSVYAYVAFKNKVYRFSTDGSNPPALSSTITTQFTISQAIAGLAVWNARMVAWSRATDTFWFSNALDFATWGSLNYLAPGYSNNGISFIAPRWNDLLIVKPNAVFSVNGVLGENATVRQVADGLNAADHKYGALVGQNNALFYISDIVSPYASNVNVISGQQPQVDAYQNFGRYVVDPYGLDYTTQPSMFALGNGDVGVVYPQNFLGVDGFYALIRDRYGKYIRIAGDSLSFYSPVGTATTRYIRRVAVASSAASPGSSTFYQNLSFPSNAMALMQVATNGYYDSGTERMWPSEKSISFAIFRKQQINAGVQNGGSGISGWTDFPLVTNGTMVLSPIETERPSKISRIFIEAALDLDQANWGDYVGEGYLEVTVINQNVDDIEFSPTPNFTSTAKTYSVTLSEIPDTASYNYLTPGEFPTEPFSADNPDKRITTTRIVRLDSNDTGYGYKHNLSVKFAGFRIKRIWVEGETR